MSKKSKNRIRKALSIGAAAFGAASTAHAQYTPPPPPVPFPGFINEALRKNNPYMNQWDFGGSVRVRYEVKDGYAIAGHGGSLDFRQENADVNNNFMMERIRFRVGYTDKWWSFLAEGRSSLVQSDERWAYTNTPAITGTVRRKGDGPEADVIDLHQAFITVGNHKEFPLSIKVGRQELSYGEERLVGAFAWNNIGRVFDAAKLRWQNPWFGVDLFGSHVVIPEDERFNEDNYRDWFWGAYATSLKVPKNILDVYFLARNANKNAIRTAPSPQFPQPSARDIYTVGFRLKSKPAELGNWDYSLESAYQFGDYQDRRAPLGGDLAPRLEHEAWMLVAQGGYTFADCWGTPRIGFEYSFGSGDSDPLDNKHETFENLFPTNHKFYGYMDFISLQNIHDVRGIFQLRPHPRLSVAVEGHGFWLADTHDNFYNVAGAPRGGTGATPLGNGYGVNPSYDSYVGSEVDVIAGYAVTRYAQLEVGFGHFFVGDYIKQSLSNPAFGSQDANYVYLQATLNF